MKDNTPDDPSEYEKFDMVSLTLERKGRNISIRSSMDIKDMIDISQKPGERHLEIKNKIDNAIKELITQIKQYDPRDFLESISIENCTCDAEFSSESLSEGSEAYAEYALSLALTEPFFEARPHPPEDELVKFSKNNISIFWNVSLYYSTEIFDESCDTDSHKYRISSIMKLLFERGDSEEVHHLDLVRGLFEPHTDLFISFIGFDINQIISYITEIRDQVSSNLYHHDPSKKPNQTNDIFEISPNERLPIKFIELISVPFGENSDFVNGSNGNYGWPTNISIIEKYPVTSYNEKYYCFVPQLLFRTVIGILERWIWKDHNSYYQKYYQKQKAEYLENKSLEYISDLLPEADVYQNLNYTIRINGQKNKTETDGIVIYDNNLFIIEAKSGQFHQFARRGNVEKIKSEVKKLIAEAYTQALRTEKFFFSTLKPVFRDNNNKIAYEENDSSRFENVFLINITLENLGSLSTHLNSLRLSGLIEGRGWPWSVNLNDLRVISEIIETPSEFLLYLQRRIRTNDFPAFKSTDELEYFSKFLDDGLYFEDGHLNNVDSCMPVGYTNEIDRYYVSGGEKPTFKIPPEFRNLIKSIEKTGKFGFTYVTTTLLGFNFETHREILERIDSMSEQVNNDGQCHYRSFLNRNLKIGLTIVIDTNFECDPSGFRANAELKKYQNHFDAWIILVINKLKNKIEKVNFEISKGHGRKIRRNDICLCGSGKKFKKCCNLRVRTEEK